jgi:L-alanine-DL-glutamate epimerase-like enolase superfamily enzyme
MRVTDVRIVSARWYGLPVFTRVPLKFGSGVVTEAVCARVCLEVETADGRRAEGWGETPLSVQWVWPSPESYQNRLGVMEAFCNKLTEAYVRFEFSGHAFEIGHRFLAEVLPGLCAAFNAGQPESLRMPTLAGIVCASPFDIALHDAYGVAHGVPVYSTYCSPWMEHDLSHYLTPAVDAAGVDFTGRFPAEYFRKSPEKRLLAWHLVGGLDPLVDGDPGSETRPDEYPVTLGEWIAKDGLEALKIKLRGNDEEWDFERLKKVSELALPRGVRLFTADFNCTVTNPEYVNRILDRIKREVCELWHRLAYVEQPFPYELEEHPIDVHSVSQRVPLFLDESAHDWRFVRLGRQLGWNGVALKTCKTQTGALLSLCWARAHGMGIMVQDLSNPMLAQIPHLLLASHAPTLAGVETNGMQFYPKASEVEAKVHPGIYSRIAGHVDLNSIGGPGFGYRLAEIKRSLPEIRHSATLTPETLL